MGKYNPDDDLHRANRTFVNSSTYEPHYRAPRGTYKKAELNDTLKLHTELMGGANTPARLVKNEIDFHRAGFPSGQLWQKLVGMFKKQLKMNIPLNVDELFLLDISKKYRMSAFLKRGLKNTVTFEESALKVELEKLNPVFRRQSIDGYQAEVAVMYFDFIQMKSSSDSAVSAIVPLNYQDVLTFALEKGEHGERYLITLKVTACYKGEVETGHSTMGMSIIRTGIVN